MPAASALTQNELWCGGSSVRKVWREAAVTGDAKAVARLLAQGLNVNDRDRYGQTALMLAALHGHLGAVRLLLDAGADKNVVAKFGFTALMLAIVNAIVRPVLFILTLPITVLTLGLFYLVINGIAFGLAAALVPGFAVSSTMSAIGGALLTSVISWFLGIFVKRDS